MRKIVKRCYHSLNKFIVDKCGRGSRLYGRIDKRNPGAFISIGDRCLIEGDIVAETSASRIIIFNNVFIGGNTLVDCVDSVMIHDDVLISHGCLLADSDNHNTNYGLRKNDLRHWMSGRKHAWEITPTRPIEISKGAWIGARSIILKGVKIGEASVIGAGSVVTRDVLPWTLVAGNPARIIRELSENER